MRMADGRAIDTASRVLAADDGTNYDKVAITLHWVTALLVLEQFLTSFIWDYFDRTTRDGLQSLHTSLGVLLAAVIVTRVTWRLMPGHQVSSLALGWVRTASKSVHALLYALLLVQAVLGFTIGWAAGHPIHLFGLPIPGPIGTLPRPTRHELREIHQWVGYTIVIVAAGHAAAALYHHYKLHDRVLGRMAPWVRRTAAS
jgi:cytochrome b561